MYPFVSAQSYTETYDKKQKCYFIPSVSTISGRGKKVEKKLLLEKSL